MTDGHEQGGEALEQVRSLAKFPDENPNPVLRIDDDGRVIYANGPSEALLAHWGIERGGLAPSHVRQELALARQEGRPRMIEIESMGRRISVAVAPISGENYTNLYGHDITEQRIAERAMTEARDQALRASQAKSSFLASMSHELRTPMNAIIGYSEMLIEEAADRGMDEFVSDLERIHSAGRHLLKLINDILDLSKVEAGRMDLYIERIDVRQMLAAVQDTMRPLRDQSGNELIIECHADVANMLTDVTKVRQILINLLSNAFKFTRKGTVTLTVSPTSVRGRPGLRFRVKDTGIGMTEEQMERIFSAFTQADNAMTREYGGTGLGLTISREFCRLLGGRIAVDSEQGVGSTFEVVLPVETRRPDPRPQPIEEAPETIRPPGSARPVLVIDDDSTVRDIMRSTLKRAGFDVATARSGDDGITLAKRLHPFAITLDVIMPGVDGWSVLSKLKNDPETRDIPVVVATISDDRSLGFSLGAVEFMTKPVDRKRLVEIIEKCAAEAESHHVLIVEDDADTRDLLCKTMVKAGWAVRDAVNGREALALVAERIPDVIVLDLMMPVMNGFDFLRRLRASERSTHVPVLVVTARELSGEEREFLRGTAQRVLEKGDLPREALSRQIRDLAGEFPTAQRGAS